MFDKIEKCNCRDGKSSLQAFKKYVCELCKKTKLHESTLAPKICDECSKEKKVCGYCLKSIINL